MAVSKRPRWMILWLPLALGCGPVADAPPPEVPRVLVSRMTSTTHHAPCAESGPWCLADPAMPSGSAAALSTQLDRLALALANDPVERRLERVAADLEERAHSQGHAEDWLALGAVQFALALGQGPGHQLVIALESTERGLEAEPQAPWGLFNRALILSELGLCRVAKGAWDRSVLLERDPSWAAEAKERQAALPCLAGSPEAEPGAHTLFEEAIDVWSQAGHQETRPRSQEALARLDSAGQRMADTFGDASLKRLAAELGAASAEPGETSANIDQCLEGRSFYQDEDYAPALALFEAAIPALG